MAMSHAARWGSPLALALVLVSAACGGGDGSDDAAVPDDAGAAVAVEPAAPPAGATAGSADQQFLREMSDHHEGMKRMAAEATQKGSPEIKTAAAGMSQKQTAEQQEMLSMLQSEGVSHQPTILPSNQAMVDSLTQKPAGAAFDMAFHMQVIAHHREGIAMIDRMLPQLTNPQVRTMAERMKVDQQKDVQDHEGKMQH
jgi:predicted outer membrane protein